MVLALQTRGNRQIITVHCDKESKYNESTHWEMFSIIRRIREVGIGSKAGFRKEGMLNLSLRG